MGHTPTGPKYRQRRLPTNPTTFRRNHHLARIHCLCPIQHHPYVETQQGLLQDYDRQTQPHQATIQRRRKIHVLLRRYTSNIQALHNAPDQHLPNPTPGI